MHVLTIMSKPMCLLSQIVNTFLLHSYQYLTKNNPQTVTTVVVQKQLSHYIL